MLPFTYDSGTYFSWKYCEFVLQFESTIVSLLLSTFVCVYGKSIKQWIFFPRKIHHHKQKQLKGAVHFIDLYIISERVTFFSFFYYHI